MSQTQAFRFMFQGEDDEREKFERIEIKQSQEIIFDILKKTSYMNLERLMRVLYESCC